jgi:hypothetical protein
VTRIAIELNDAGLVALTGGPGAAPPPSPGCAVVDEDGRIATGSAARRRARVAPRRADDRAWSDLDRSPLGPPFPPGVSRADLAHAHLAALWEAAGGTAAAAALFAVPGSFSRARLGLVLGIAHAAGIPVRGLVDAAVAAASASSAPAERLVLLDLELHRAVLTEIASDGHDLVRQKVELSPKVGLARIDDRFAAAVAAASVRQTRFDPLHAAPVEQDLYDRLPGLLAALGSGDRVQLDLGPAGERRPVQVARAPLVAAVDAEYGHLAGLVHRRPSGPPALLVLSARVAGLPGLGERLAHAAGCAPLAVPLAAAAATALALSDRIEVEGPALPLVTRLPRSASAVAAAGGVESRPAAPGARGPAPTHLVLAGRAYPIGDEPFVVGVAIPPASRGLNLTGETAGVSRAHCRLYRRDGAVVVEDASTYGTFLNGERVDGRAALAAGDRLRLGSPGIELELVAVDSR